MAIQTQYRDNKQLNEAPPIYIFFQTEKLNPLLIIILVVKYHG